MASIGVFSMVSISENSTTASVRIARYIAKTLGLPLYHNEEVANYKWDALILVNGPMLYCKCLPTLADVVERTPIVVWAQNDYTLPPPKPESNAESPFRKVFRDRKLVPIYWTTIPENLELGLAASRYVNWNMLPAAQHTFRSLNGEDKVQALFYYGSYRENRAKDFKRWFCDNGYPVVVSSPSKKFSIFDHPRVIPAIMPNDLYRTIGRYTAGLYIEDSKSHTSYHSPPTRFYEMLVAGTYIVVDAGAAATLERAGLKVESDWVAQHPADIRDIVRSPHRAVRRMTEQRIQWNMDYGRLLHGQLKDAYDQLKLLIRFGT